MNNKKRGIFFNIFIVGISVLFLCQANVLAKVVANYSDEAFEDFTREEIRVVVIEAAGEFLKSHSDLLLFSNRVELEELHGADQAELRHLIAGAAEHMERAAALYGELVRISSNASYNRAIIDKLMNMEYSSTVPQLSAANSDPLGSASAGRVETYLRSGDVRGLYHKLLLDAGEILGLLNTLKASVDAGDIPGAAELWKINRLYCRTLLFGQDAAEAFFRATGKSKENGLK